MIESDISTWIISMGLLGCLSGVFIIYGFVIALMWIIAKLRGETLHEFMQQEDDQERKAYYIHIYGKIRGEELWQQARTPPVQMITEPEPDPMVELEKFTQRQEQLAREHQAKTNK